MLTHTGTQPIRTSRLLLRPFSPDDADAILRNWIADEQVQALYLEPVYATRAEVEGWLAEVTARYARPDYYRWAVTLPETGECIGQIAFFLMDSKNHFAEIEYCIGRAFQRRGYAVEATRAVTAYGFEAIHLHKVQISHPSGNLPSRRVIEKCGFVYEGCLRDYFYLDGQYVDRLFYSLLRSEFAAD